MSVRFFLQGSEQQYEGTGIDSGEPGKERFARLSTILNQQLASWRQSSSADVSRLRDRIRDAQYAVQNLIDVISVVKTAERGLDQALILLNMMDEVAKRSRDHLAAPDQTNLLQLKFETLNRELSATVTQTSFLGQCLLDGSFSRRTYQTGADRDGLITIELTEAIPKGLESSHLSDEVAIDDAIHYIERASVQLHLMRQNLQSTKEKLGERVDWLGTEIFNMESVDLTLEDEELVRDAALFARFAFVHSNDVALLAQGNLSRSNAARLVRPKTRKKHRLC
jgi:flagellin